MARAKATQDVFCKHFAKESKTHDVYFYPIVDGDIGLCLACEEKLRQEIFDQIKIEKDLVYLKKKYKWLGTKKTNGRKPRRK